MAACIQYFALYFCILCFVEGINGTLTNFYGTWNVTLRNAFFKFILKLAFAFWHFLWNNFFFINEIQNLHFYSNQKEKFEKNCHKIQKIFTKSILHKHIRYRFVFLRSVTIWEMLEFKLWANQWCSKLSILSKLNSVFIKFKKTFSCVLHLQNTIEVA